MPTDEQFFAALVHDLRQPLRTIVTNGQRLRGTLDAAQASGMDAILAAAAKQEQLLAAVLQFAAAGDVEESGRRQPLRLCVETACRKLEPYRREQNGEIRVGALPGVTVPALVAAILEQLIHNGLTFHKPEQCPLVGVNACSVGGTVELAVSDSGIGIAPELREAVFEPFRRLNPISSYPGSGLGLATCRRLAAAIGGTVQVADHPQTTVTVRLPVE